MRAPGAIFALVVMQQLCAQSLPPEVVKQFAPTGTLRAAINHGNPLLATRDKDTGELRGVAIDLSRELAKRLGVPLTLVPFDAAGKMTAVVKDNVWDIAWLGIDPARAQEIDYSAAYIELEGTYLVPSGSKLRAIDDVDHEGVRISVTAKSAYDLYLSRVIQKAQLVRAASTPESIDLFAAEKLDAVAGVKTALVDAAKRFPGSRVLPGHFMTIPQASGVPKGRPAAAKYLADFIEEMKASGFVAAALKRDGLTPDDAVVAPPAR